MTKEEKASTIDEYKSALAEKNQLLNTLAAKYDAQAAYLGAQDVNYVEAGDNENRFVGRVADFLNEVGRDQKNYETLQSGSQALRDKLGSVVTRLDDIQAKTNWDSQEQDRYGGDNITVGNLAYDNYVKSSATLADLTKDYVNKLDGTAAALSQAWKQTKHNEYKKELWSGINTVIDLVTGMGIGGNASIQFAAKEFNEVKKSFDRLTNAYWLRAGQVGDLGQAAMNIGAGLKNFSSPTGSGPATEIQGNTDSSVAHLKELTEQFNAWITEYNKDHHGDPNPFVPL